MIPFIANPTEIVGAMPLHLACARPLCRLKAPLGLSLLRCASQTRSHPKPCSSFVPIISFDPRDAADNGLTMEKAQALGLKFCEENFPGHPAIVCTHPDGHNHSGNIHVHIVIGSIRMREVERKPYMQKPRNWLEGMKHSSTAQTMRHLRVEVMELCEGAGLYQIDLLNGSKERVSEAEYWARRRGQLKLDRENAALTATGQPPKQKKFETAKETLRKQILDVLDNATSFEDFSDKLMQQYGIAVKKSRGRLSYLPAGRTKFIRAKHLGDKFDKVAVLAMLQANAERKPKVQFKQDTLESTTPRWRSLSGGFSRTLIF